MRLREAGGESGRLPEVPAKPNDTHVAGARVQARQRGERPVGRAVVDVDGLPLVSERFQGRLELLVEKRDASLLVVDRDDDRDHAARLASPAWPSFSESR